MHRPYCVADRDGLSRQQGSPSMADRSVEVNAISGRKSMPEGTIRSHTAQPPGGNQPDRRLSEGIIDNLVLYQHECGTGRMLRGDAGVARLVHLIEPIRYPCRHALLKALRCPAKGKTSQPRIGGPKLRQLCPHGAVDDMEQVTQLAQNRPSGVDESKA
jgi:hypothetical protein